MAVCLPEALLEPIILSSRKTNKGRRSLPALLGRICDVGRSAPAYRAGRLLCPFARASRGLNDNNHPFSSGRNPGKPDPDEFIIIKLDAPLPQ
jgi:hypothetical protein